MNCNLSNTTPLRYPSQVAWKTISHKMPDGTSITIPSLTRMVSKATMFRRYVLKFVDRERLKEDSFYRISRAITRKQIRSLRAVDYYETDLLLFPKTRLLALIRDAVDDDETLCNKLVAEVEVIYSQVQFAYPKLITFDTNGDTKGPPTSVSYAMGVDGHAEASSGAPNATVVTIIRYFQVRLPNAHVNLGLYKNTIIAHCYGKIKLFMSHALRIKTQSSRMTVLQLRCVGAKSVYITMDYMM